MDMVKIEEIKQKHLTTKQHRMAEKAIKTKAHEDAVDDLCEIILRFLETDAAYDNDNDTAWVKITYRTDEYDRLVLGTTHLLLPNGDTSGWLGFDYGVERYKPVWRDVLNKFGQLEGFAVDGRKITMLLED